MGIGHNTTFGYEGLATPSFGKRGLGSAAGGGGGGAGGGATINSLGAQAYFDWTNTDNFTLSSLKIVTTTDLTGNGYDITQASGTKQGTWDATEGANLMGSSTQQGTISSITADSLIIVAENNGGGATFANYNGLVAGPMAPGGSSRVMGSQGTANLHDSNVAYVNGSTVATNAILPLPKGLIRLDLNGSTGFMDVMCVKTVGSFGWQGFVYKFVVPAVGTSLADLQLMEGILAWETGIQGSLDAAHPHKATDPR